MNATDLMIGDWLMADNELLKVSDILRYRIYAHDAVEYYPIENLKPILLTFDILNKNGFELVDIGDNGPATPKANINRYEKWECKTMFQTFYLYYDRCSKYYSLNAFGNHISHIMYVHELQHSLRLCRITKEVDI